MKPNGLFVGVIIIYLVLSPISFGGTYSGGTGEPNNPYQIADANDLLALGATTADYGKSFILTADIDLDPNLLDGQVFTTAVIAIDTNSTDYLHEFQGTAFKGTFDGGGHKITHLTISGGGNERLGLFGYIGSGGSVKNVDIENCVVSGSYYVGGLVGENYDGSINSCHSTGTVDGNESVGGLVGWNLGSISNCYSTGTVSGFYNVGGLAGSHWFSNISNCYSTGAVSGGPDSENVGGLTGGNCGGIISNCHSTGAVSGSLAVGGLVGGNDGFSISNCYSTGAVSGYSDSQFVGGLVGVNNFRILKCYSTGAVSGYSGVGGLVGYNHGSGYDRYINDCYSTGAVSGSLAVGGLVGGNDGFSIGNCYSTGAVSGSSGSQLVGGLVGTNDGVGTISSCFWDMNTSGQTTSAAGTGLDTTQMKQQASFTHWGFPPAWDTWAICEGTNYPRLIWQIPAWDFVCPDGVNFADYSFFATHWSDTNCAANNNCSGADLDVSGGVDWKDMMMFCQHWLEGQ